MNGLWVEPDIRDTVVSQVAELRRKTNITTHMLLQWLGVRKGKYYRWESRVGTLNNHNGKIPRKTWLLNWEREAILHYYEKHREEGYRRLTYMMLDENIVAVSPSSTYRVLSGSGMLTRWNTKNCGKKKKGFDQPTQPHEHWHTDIKYVNFRGTFLFLIVVIDGYSRYIVHHEVRKWMQQYDVQLTIERALEKYPGVKPRIISDNGSQFISKEFAEFIRLANLQHVRTSIAHPQANGKVERFNGTISQECLRKQSFLSLEDARATIAHYVESYNTKRLHSSLYFLTPEDFLMNRQEERISDRDRKLEEAELNRREQNRAA